MPSLSLYQIIIYNGAHNYNAKYPEKKIVYVVVIVILSTLPYVVSPVWSV